MGSVVRLLACGAALALLTGMPRAGETPPPGTNPAGTPPVADARRAADEDAQTLAFLRERYPRLAEEAELVRKSNHVRYRQLLDRARHMRELRQRFEGAQEARDPELEALRVRIRDIVAEQERLRADIAERKAEYATATDAARDTLRTTLRGLVARAFDLTTERRQLELKERELHLRMLQERMKTFREGMESRIRNRDAYIDRFLERLLDERKDDGADSPAGDSGDGEAEILDT